MFSKSLYKSLYKQLGQVLAFRHMHACISALPAFVVTKYQLDNDPVKLILKLQEKKTVWQLSLNDVSLPTKP